MRRLLSLLILFGTFTFANAQYFQTGQDPASIKWRQINTKSFQIIYPDYYESQAQKLGYVLEKVYSYGGKTLNHSPKKISVILHTQTVKSNGLVAYAPKRAEFYTTPHQGIYPQDWLEQLAIHEFRHVVQVDKINSEIPKLIKIILGEQGTALIFGLYLPWWYTEGDAVVMETALSNYGRGRLPSFLMEHKAQVVEKGVYSYDKAYNGSIKDFIPNHYKLGYYLAGNARFRYGSNVWSSVLDNVGKRPLSLNPFNSALKKNTGFNKVQLYESVFDSLNSVWQEMDRKYESEPLTIISPEKNTFTNYQYLHWFSNKTLIAYKESLNEIPSFVSIDDRGNEKRIVQPGAIFRESVNYRNELIVWSEHIPDMRWEHSGKSLIRIFNVFTRDITEIKPEFKCFSPSISPDMQKIAVVETDFSSNNYLSVYSKTNGKLLSRIQIPDNNYMFSPEWLNEKELAVIILTSNGKRLARIKLGTGETTILIDRDLGDLKHLKLAGTDLYFICSYTGKNGLYSYNLENETVRFVYKPRFGAEYPAVLRNENKIALSDYTSNGFRIIIISPKKEDTILLEQVKEGKYPLAEVLSKQEPGIPDFSIPDSTFASDKYNKAAHLFNFHSWAPAFVNASSYEVFPGASLMSQNKLGTAETILGYKWNTTEKTGKYYAGYTFKGWYPVIKAEFSSGNSASEYLSISQITNQNGHRQDTSLQRFTWKETTADLSIRIPLTLTKGIFNRFLQPEFKFDFTSYGHDSSTPDRFYKGNFQLFSYRLYFYQFLKQSSQDVYPDFGLILDGMYRHSPTGVRNVGNMASAQTYLFLPGILKNHGLRFYYGIQQKRSMDFFNFSESIKYPRGWGKINTTDLYSMGVDYKLPLIYPDLSVGGLAYIKRINTSLFTDFANLKGNIYRDGEVVGRYNKNISSSGLELTADVHFLRFYAPINIGTRASYLPELKHVYFDFLLSVNLTSL